ncbi:MAG: Eco57I restriction-modification methylase domain-containing protein [Candidatus Omnitrophica bacterium]|nr:Eco57I restriction-modification methylase domain-containing protein [Candidatus Omnitrophota bacterium]
MPTVECIERKTIIDHRYFPCANSHRPMLYDLLSAFNEKDLDGIDRLDSLLIGAIITVIRRLKGHRVDSTLSKCLSAELSIRENYEFSTKLNCLMRYEVAKLEELISIIFQTKSLREDSHTNGALTRKQNGVFHTPYPIAGLIAKEAISFVVDKLFCAIKSCKDKKRRQFLYNKFLNLSVIDPACGTGIILSATIDYLATMNDKLGLVLSKTPYYKRRREFIEHIVVNGIFGVDIDSEASSVVQALFKAKYDIRNSDLTSNIKSGDSLSTGDLFYGNEFSYEKEFPSIFSANGGFDILVMNPPYERLKVDKSDFKDANDEHRLYEKNKKFIGGLVSMIKKSHRYPLSDEGVLDLYKLFIDRATQITNEKGIVSFIVPLSLLGDRSCRNIRGYIFEAASMGNIYCIPENANAFHDVSQAFCVMGFKKGRPKKSFSIYQDTITVEPLRYSKKINITTSDIGFTCPSTYSIPICDGKGWEILKIIHKNPPLAECKEIENLRGELDLTFGKKYVTSDSSEEILIRGNVINAYSLKQDDSSKESYAKLKQMVADKFLNSKLKYVNSDRIVCQQISNMGIKKRLKFAYVNKGVVANSCNFLSIGKRPMSELFYLLGLLNSSLLNWRFKLTSTNNHINNYELAELPIARQDNVNKKISKKIIELTIKQCECYSNNVQDEIDKIVCEAYGLSLNQVDTFNI